MEDEMMEDEWVPHERESWPWSFGRLTRDVVGRRYLGDWDANGPLYETLLLPKGTLVRIVMVSRFGDIGITPNLNDVVGYVARISFDDIRRER